LGTIDPRPAATRRARFLSSIWKFAALTQLLRSLLRSLRVARALPDEHRQSLESLTKSTP
jgi:hypothetical protein